MRTSSEIKECSFNADFDYQPNVSHTVKYGFKTAIMQFNPDVVRARGNLGDTTFNSDQQIQSTNLSVYLEDEIKIGERWVSNIGLRGALFLVENQQYWDLQPRASMRYLVNDELSFKASYSRTVQYLHLLTNSSLGLPTDLWVSSTKNTRPEQAWQIATGAAWSPTRQFEFTLEGYYRGMSNLIEYAEGASYLYGTSDYWEDKIVVGDGTAYGAELLFRKNTGRITGWAGYTLAWANRQFDDIDEGQTFPFRYDRRHDISLLVNYQVGAKKPTVTNFLSLAFAFNTGGATSFPEATYQGINLPDWISNEAFEQREYIAQRNNFRVPAYHRMDLSFSNEKQKKGYKRTWMFSIYNVYNRLNAYFLYESEGTIKQVSLFPIIPSVSYRLEF